MKKIELQNLSEEDERRLNEVFALRDELFNIFGDKMVKHDIDTAQALSIMVSIVYEVAGVVAQSNNVLLGDVINDIKHGLDILSDNEKDKNE